MIRIQNVSHQFSANGNVLPVLERVSLDVSDREVVGIVGPSGCGKSTLLRIASGLLEPTRGSVHVDGVSPALARRLKFIGFAFQDPVLLPWLSVRQNISLPDEIGIKTEHHEDLDALIAMVGLSEFTEFKPDQLSGGMKQRVALARALFIKPKVLLMDEPFGALDLLLRTKLVIEVASILRRARMTSVIVTHDVAEAVISCDRIHVFSGRPGRFVEEIAIPLGEERNLELMRSPLFQEKVVQLREILMAEQ